MKQYFQYTEAGGNIPAPKPIEPIDDVDFIILDLFCGAGGTTTGFDQAVLKGKKCAIIAACINHDFKAIKSHWLNHPDVEHYEEDITKMYGAVKSFPVFNWKTLQDGFFNIFFKSPELLRLERLIEIYRAFYPNAKFILWASLECTNFSKAKGGLPRDADSRTLADHLDRYIAALNPDYIQIENVVEFMSWGPLDEKGKPVSKKQGRDFMRWKDHINSFGYYNEWKELNSADFGAYTSRNRLFGCFAKHGMPVVWPDATHAKKPKINSKGQTSLFASSASLHKWKPVRDVLDFDDEGNSIFNRKKPLSEKTLERIYAGLIKYVAGGKDKFMQQIYACDSKGSGNYPVDRPARTVTTRDGTGIVQTSFISTYNSGNDAARNRSLDDPCGPVLTANTYAFVNTSFIAKYYSGKPEGKVISIDGPAGALRTTDGQSLVQCFLSNYYSNGGESSSIDGPAGVLRTKAGIAKIWLDKSFSGSNNHQSIDGPAGALLQKDHYSIMQAHWIDRNFSQGAKDSSVNDPAGALLTVPKINLMSVKPFVMNTNYSRVGTSIDEPTGPLMASRRYYYIVNPSYKNQVHSVDVPSPVIIAKQDKKPLYITNVISGMLENDMSSFLSELDQQLFLDLYFTVDPYGPMLPQTIQFKIVEFMLLYRIRDIKMRMLKVPELLKIQGFPEDYQLYGNQADQKKFIGNSVHPLVPKFWAETLALKLRYNIELMN